MHYNNTSWNRFHFVAVISINLSVILFCSILKEIKIGKLWIMTFCHQTWRGLEFLYMYLWIFKFLLFLGLANNYFSCTAFFVNLYHTYAHIILLKICDNGSGGTRIFFFCGGHWGGKMRFWGGKNQKICRKWLILAIFFFWLGGGQVGGRASDGGGQMPPCPPPLMLPLGHNGTLHNQSGGTRTHPAMEGLHVKLSKSQLQP